MSNTPRVDRVHWNHAFLKEEAYKLERELNAANERIKRLEEAGDEMHISCSDRLARRKWTTAKEANS